MVIRTKQDAQLVQPWQIVGQRSQRIRGQIENLQRLGQVENLAWKFSQATGQLQMATSRQLAGAQVFKGVQ